MDPTLLAGTVEGQPLPEVPLLHVTSLTPSWQEYFKRSRCRTRRYQVLAHPVMEEMALKLCELSPDRFMYHRSSWKKFADGTDNIHIGGFQVILDLQCTHACSQRYRLNSPIA